ncbi:MAG: type II toxin-antitoxin system VapC family toxin [Sphingomonadaceae bacterium]
MSRFRPLTHGHLPEFIYFDTSFLILAAIGDQDQRLEAARFLRRLLEHGTHMIVSNLVLLESWHAALLSAAEDYAGEGWEEDFKRPDFRKEVLPHAEPIMRRVDQILDSFVDRTQGQIVAIGTEDMDNAARCMRAYGLDSYDASHAGVMMTYDIHDIATNDRHFREVPDFNLWLFEGLCRDLRDNY